MGNERIMHFANTALPGYSFDAGDGPIEAVVDLRFDDPPSRLRYLMLDTSNWWMGKHVLLSPCAVTDNSWSAHEVSLNIPQSAVNPSSTWNPVKLISQVEEHGLNSHYGW